MALSAMGALAAIAAGPLEVIQDSNAKILELYAGHGDGNDAEVDRDVFAVMDEVTSFSRIAASAIDAFCDDPTGDACRDFRETFTELLKLSSIKKLGRYRADGFDYLDQAVDGSRAVVRTLARYGEDEVELTYHLGYVADRWVIVNYVVDGVDTIKNYKKQFSRMLRTSSVEEVTHRLRKRVADLEREP